MSISLIKQVADLLILIGGTKIKDDVIRFEYFGIDYYRKKLGTYKILDIQIVINESNEYPIFLCDFNHYTDYMSYFHQYYYSNEFRDLEQLKEESFDEMLLNGYCPAIRKRWQPLIPSIRLNKPIIIDIVNPVVGSEIIYIDEFLCEKYKKLYTNIIQELKYQ